MELGTQICGDLDAAARREWLVPDGLGGYAMGTVAGLRTRRYHGLLVVAHPRQAQPGPAHRVALAALDPVLILPGGTEVRLATHEWASGAVAPAGHALLERFDLTDGLPRWRWRVGEVVLERELAMHRGAAGPALAVVHRLLAGPGVRLAAQALCTWRDAHSERYAHDGLEVAPTGDGCVVEGAYRIAGPGFAADGTWWHGAYHREEAARGLNPTEDLCRVGSFTAELTAPGAILEISAWAGDLAAVPPPAAEVVAAARARRFADPLARAADAFVVAGPDVVAGYPWFGAWSRDTMISYEGLFLATGRADQGRALLHRYAGSLDAGMLPNTADTGQVSYNTADATLWLLHAVDRHLAATGDDDLAAELARPLGEVVARHVAGTRYGLRVEADGLLTQGAAGHALTWMDAVVDGVPVSRRAGKAVEVNALWINGLGALAALRARIGADATDLHRLRDRAVTSFRGRFPAPTGWLYDTVDPDDAALRPNQLLAYGLPYAPLAPDARVVRTIGAALLTPLGLRTLAPAEPGYRGRHRGSPAARDGAYHQGTVWPWLLGPYADACRAAGVPTDELWAGLLAHLRDWGLGSVSETADGDPPHAATGCPFQAWSVAELCRHLHGGPRPAGRP